MHRSITVKCFGSLFRGTFFSYFMHCNPLQIFSGGARGNMGMNGGGDGKWQHHNGILLFIFFYKSDTEIQKTRGKAKAGTK